MHFAKHAKRLPPNAASGKSSSYVTYCASYLSTLSAIFPCEPYSSNVPCACTAAIKIATAHTTHAAPCYPFPTHRYLLYPPNSRSSPLPRVRGPSPLLANGERHAAESRAVRKILRRSRPLSRGRASLVLHHVHRRNQSLVIHAQPDVAISAGLPMKPCIHARTYDYSWCTLVLVPYMYYRYRVILKYIIQENTELSVGKGLVIVTFELHCLIFSSLLVRICKRRSLDLASSGRRSSLCDSRE